MSTPPINAAPLALSDDPRLYESGWVDASGWLINGWVPAAPGRCRAFRFGPLVFFQAYLDGTNATSDALIKFVADDGFSGYDLVLSWVVLNSTTSGAAEVQQMSREATARGVPRTRIFISGSWATTDPVPT